MHSKFNQILTRQRREILQPMGRIGKLPNILVHQSQALHDLPLVLGAARLCNGLALLALALVLRYNIPFDDGHHFIGAGRENRRIAKRFDFTQQFVGACLDRHSGAVEAEREQHTLSLQSLVSHSELE